MGQTSKWTMPDTVVDSMINVVISIKSVDKVHRVKIVLYSTEGSHTASTTALTSITQQYEFLTKYASMMKRSLVNYKLMLIFAISDSDL